MRDAAIRYDEVGRSSKLLRVQASSKSSLAGFSESAHQRAENLFINGILTIGGKKSSTMF